jgi:hypothetical protein
LEPDEATEPLNTEATGPVTVGPNVSKVNKGPSLAA